MVEQKLQELKLPLGQGHLVALVSDHATCRIQPQTLQLPQAAVPEVEPFLVAAHLRLDDLEIGGCSPLGGGGEGCYVTPPPPQDSPLELQEVGVDAHPVAGIFPAVRPDVLALERSRCLPAARTRGARRSSRAGSLLSLPHVARQLKDNPDGRLRRRQD